MIDNRTFEKLKFIMEQAARDYTKAENEAKSIKSQAIDKIREVCTDGLMTKQILDDMLAQVQDREDAMRWAEEEFRNAKEKLLTAVQNITLPKGY